MPKSECLNYVYFPFTDSGLYTKNCPFHHTHKIARTECEVESENKKKKNEVKVKMERKTLNQNKTALLSGIRNGSKNKKRNEEMFV